MLSPVRDPASHQGADAPRSPTPSWGGMLAMSAVNPNPIIRPPRLPGYDVARALAVWGMVAEHFALVLAAAPWGPAWLAAAAGFLNLAVWPGDILRVYGVGLLLAALCLDAPARRLWLIAVAFALSFILLCCVLDYEAHWEWDMLTYRGLWTPAGVVRNLFFDGFLSVFPCAGLLCVGLCLGR